MGSYALRIEETGNSGVLRRGEDEEVDSKSDCIGFSAGNPRVDTIEGVVHLYRELVSRPESCRTPCTHEE